MTSRRARWLSLLLLLAVTSANLGCAYYNTFYLARKYYRQGQDEDRKNTTGKVSPNASGFYDKAIKQCSKVLQRYRGSKWGDDALLLMGQCYYGQGAYGESRRWLSEIATNFPKSELIPDAKVWIGRCWLEEEQYEQAGKEFKETMEGWPDFELRDDALFYAAETHLREENWTDAIAGFSELLDKYPKSPRVPEALERIGDARYGLRQYPEAEQSYKAAASKTVEPRQRVLWLLEVGVTLEKQEKFAEAMALYDHLSAELVPRDRLNTILSGFDAVVPAQPVGAPLGANGLPTSGNPQDAEIQSHTYVDSAGNQVFQNPLWNQQNNNTNGQPGAPGAPNPTATATATPRRSVEGNVTARAAAALAAQGNALAADLPQILLRHGNALMEMGQYDRAIRTFDAILASYPRTSEAGEAQYRIGYIQEVYLEDYAAAHESYDAVKAQGPGTFVDQATRRSTGLARLVALQADSTSTKADQGVEKEAEKQFLAAELAWFQQEHADKAIEQYALVELNYPTTTFAPRSALARAWLLANVTNDTTGAETAYQNVVDKYPGTDQAKMAHQILTGEVVIEQPHPDSLAIAAFEDSLDKVQKAKEAALAAVPPPDTTGSGVEPDPDAGRTPVAAATAITPVTPETSGAAIPATIGAAAAAASVDPQVAAREEARRRSENEARQMAQAAEKNGAGTAVGMPLGAPGVEVPAAAGATGATMTALDPGAGGVAPTDSTGRMAPAAPLKPSATPKAEPLPDSTALASVVEADRPASRLAPENATGLPRPLSTHRAHTGPAPHAPRQRPPGVPVPNPTVADTTRSRGGSGGGRTPEQARP